MDVRRRWARALVAVGVVGLVCLTTAACGFLFQRMSNDIVVGQWVHVDDSGNTTTATFSSDMTFTAENVPTQVYDLFGQETKLDWSDTVDITGEWKVEDDGSLGITAFFPDIKNIRYFYLYRWGAGSDLELYSYVGGPDLDIRFSYKKLQ